MYIKLTDKGLVLKARQLADLMEQHLHKDDKGYSGAAQYVDEFHAILEEIESRGINKDDFPKE